MLHYSLTNQPLHTYTDVNNINNTLIKPIMKPKRSQRISRMKVPNLKDNVLRSQPQAIEAPKFFYKVNNGFKLLEKQFINFSGEGAFMFNKQSQLPIIKRKEINSRLSLLAYPQQRSASMPGQLTKKKLSQLNQSVTKIQKQPINSSRNRTQSMNNNKMSHPSVGEIIGSSLATLPISQILALKQKSQLVKQKKTDGHSDSQQDPEDIKHRDSQRQQQWVFTKSQNVIDCLDNIINGQNKTYDRYDKKLMEKVQFYRSKEFKISYQNSWK